jgi:hypothetical protein
MKSHLKGEAVVRVNVPWKGLVAVIGKFQRPLEGRL